MRDRKKQRENRRRYKTNPCLNASGCYDMTAYRAIQNVTREEREEKKTRQNAKKA